MITHALLREQDESIYGPLKTQLGALRRFQGTVKFAGVQISYAWLLVHRQEDYITQPFQWSDALTTTHFLPIPLKSQLAEPKSNEPRA